MPHPLTALGLLAGLTLLSPAALAALDFQPCADRSDFAELADSQCARVNMPADHAQAGGEQIELFLRRFPAPGQARGTVWLVAGGPGESGAMFYPLRRQLAQAFPGYDLIIPDHRGTGFSTRLCPAEEAVHSPGGAALEGAEWASCYASLAQAPARLQQFSLAQAADDLAALLARDASMGPRYLYAVSYGTQLSLRMLASHRPRLDGLLLDSLVPRQDDAAHDLSMRSHDVDRAGWQWLADCAADPACVQAAGPKLGERYRAWLASQDAATSDSLRLQLGSLLDGPEPGRDLIRSLNGLLQGDPTALQAAQADQAARLAPFLAYPQSPPALPLTQLISASENDLQPTRSLDEVRRSEAELGFLSPLPRILARHRGNSYARSELALALPLQLPPTLLLHGSHDPKTSYAGAVSHLQLLRTRGPVSLHRVLDGSHFLLWHASACSVPALRDFLASPRAARAQRADSECRQP